MEITLKPYKEKYSVQKSSVNLLAVDPGQLLRTPGCHRDPSELWSLGTTPAHQVL